VITMTGEEALKAVHVTTVALLMGMAAAGALGAALWSPWPLLLSALLQLAVVVWPRAAVSLTADLATSVLVADVDPVLSAVFAVGSLAEALYWSRLSRSR